MKKTLLITILLLSLFFAVAGSIQAAEGDYPTIVQDYPKLKACEGNEECRPGEAGFGLPQFIKYIFIFSLGIVGIIGLLALIIAAWDYVMSAGNPQKAAQGKDKIVSALLGLLLLLGSWVLLNTINPDLLKLKMEKEVVEVIIEGGEEERCRAFGSAGWDKGTINEGESAIFFIQLSEECKEIPQGTLRISDWEIHLWQVWRESSVERQNGRCNHFTDFNRNMTKNRIEGSCRFNEVDNGLENKPERFYMANGNDSGPGRLTIEGVTQYLGGKPVINVVDNQ